MTNIFNTASTFHLANTSTDTTNNFFHIVTAIKMIHQKSKLAPKCFEKTRLVPMEKTGNNFLDKRPSFKIVFFTFLTLLLFLCEFVRLIFRGLFWTLKEDCHEKLKQDTFLNIKNNNKR